MQEIELKSPGSATKSGKQSKPFATPKTGRRSAARKKQVVDDFTRDEANISHLEDLERDNAFQQDEFGTADGLLPKSGKSQVDAEYKYTPKAKTGDESTSSDDDDEKDASFTNKRNYAANSKSTKKQASKRRKLDRSKAHHGSSSAASAAGAGASSGKSASGVVAFRKRKLDLIFFDEKTPGSECNLDDTTTPSYFNNVAQPSTLPRRFFCSMCGNIAPYSCVRCGQRYCSVGCCEQHKETKCMKFGAL